MKRLLAALGACALALTGCSDTTTTSSASLPGPNSLAVAGRSLLIVSTASDELRALDLSLKTRAFVRAPNPIYPLSIPTAPLPRSVTAFTSAGGKTPKFGFALSPAAGLVNVISVGENPLKGLMSLGAFAVPDTALALAVTRPGTAEDTWEQDTTQAERLVLAVSQGENGSLWLANVPQTLAASPADIPSVQPSLAVLLGTSIPQVLVASPADSNVVAVGDRLTEPDGLGRTGGLAICNLITNTVTRLDVGGPVAALAFDQAGARLFGLYDAEACGSEHPCNGLFGVDVSDPGAPKLLGSVDVPSTARGLAVGGSIVVTLPLDTDPATTVTVDPLIMVSATDGSLYAFDGATLLPVDGATTTANPSVTSFTGTVPPHDAVTTETVTTYTTSSPVDGPQVFDSAGTLLAELTRGVVRTETLTLTWEGALVQGRGGRVSSGTLTDPAYDFAALKVAAGDLLVLTCADGTTTVEATVASAGRGTLSTSGLDASCLPAGQVTYAVRAPAAFVVFGSRSGLLGRALPDSTFSDGGVRFAIGPRDSEIVRNTTFKLELNAGIVPFELPLGTSVELPGAMTYDPLNKLFYAAYPGGNAVLEIKPTEMRSNDTSTGIVAYE